MAMSMSVSGGAHNPRHNTDLEYRATLANVEPSLSRLNVVLADEDARDVYTRLFGPSLAAYNARQADKGHPERQIADYYAKVRAAWQADQAKVRAGKKGRSNVPAPQVEYVMQVGNRDTWRDALSPADCRRIYADCYDLLREETAGAIEWYQAVVHFDEDGAPHLHVAGVPYGAGNKRGLDVQVSMSQALRTLGCERLPDLQDLMMRCLEDACRAHGIERDVMGCDRPHLDVAAWKQAQRDVAAMTERVEEQAERAAQAAMEAAEAEDEAEASREYIRDAADGMECLRWAIDDLDEAAGIVDAAEAKLAEYEKAGTRRGRAIVGELDGLESRLRYLVDRISCLVDRAVEAFRGLFDLREEDAPEREADGLEAVFAAAIRSHDIVERERAARSAPGRSRGGER